MIYLDKIASSTLNADLPDKVEISDQIDCQVGAILAVEVLEDKKIYNKLELPSGRMATLHKGDILAVVLGRRSALRGFVGDTPESLAVGDTIHMLNVGGIAGICTSENLIEVGNPFRLKVLGHVNDKHKKPLNIADFKKFAITDQLTSSTPLIIVSGTCMHVGKTSIASEIIKQLSKSGKTIFAAKMAGIAALKDTEDMRDHGAKKVASLIDAGLPSTVRADISVKATKGAINYLSQDNPDYIVIEFGDGLLGEYGVMDILQDSEIQKHIAFHIGCANDPVGAIKLVEMMKDLKLPINFISGPISDNSVGKNFIKQHCHLPALNAFSDGDKINTYFTTQ